MAYVTAEQVLESLGWLQEIPEFVSGQTPVIETVDDSGTISDGTVVYLDHNNIIADSLVLAYGASSSSITNLAVTTDFTLDAAKGKITINATGAGKIGTDNLYAVEYKYIEIDGRTSYSESFFTNLITAKEAWINTYCQQSFDTPTQVLREQHYGKGRYGQLYRPYQLLPFVKTLTLSSDVASDATEFTVSSTTGLSSGDYLTIGTEVVTIDTVDDATTLTVTRATLGTTASAHAANAKLVNVVIEVSNNDSGVDTSFTVQQYEQDWDFTEDTGSFILHFVDVTQDGLILDQYPPKGVPNRVRITYSYGRSSVPQDVQEATKQLVAKHLMSTRIGKSSGEGTTEFTLGQAPEVMDTEIKALLQPHRLILGSHS